MHADPVIDADRRGDKEWAQQLRREQAFDLLVREFTNTLFESPRKAVSTPCSLHAQQSINGLVFELITDEEDEHTLTSLLIVCAMAAQGGDLLAQSTVLQLSHRYARNVCEQLDAIGEFSCDEQP